MARAAPCRVAVACSGGRDSTALLHATARGARAQGVEVHALHVHHGLRPEADAWVAHLRAQCARWRRAGLPVTLHVRRLQVRPRRGESIEAWARRERYAALASMARDLGIGTVLLAHHRRDQAETVLLQTLRGAGGAGTAAMPTRAEREGIAWLRPWLAQPREAIEAYVRTHRLAYVDDTSNPDPRFARNRLRAAVWPALVRAFPDAEVALALAARRRHEEVECARALAAIDAEACLDARGALRRDAWLALDAPRRANLLRHWLRAVCANGVPDTLVERLLLELPAARAASAWPAGASMLRLHAGALRPVTPDRRAAPHDTMRIDLSRPGRHRIDSWRGCFVVTRDRRHGLPGALLQSAELRMRVGGEQFQQSAGAVPRSLKKAFQAGDVAAWERAAPLVFGAGGQLLFVPGLGPDSRVVSPGDPSGLRLRWVPDIAAAAPHAQGRRKHAP